MDNETALVLVAVGGLVAMIAWRLLREHKKLHIAFESACSACIAVARSVIAKQEDTSFEAQFFRQEGVFDQWVLSVPELLDEMRECGSDDEKKLLLRRLLIEQLEHAMWCAAAIGPVPWLQEWKQGDANTLASHLAVDEVRGDLPASELMEGQYAVSAMNMRCIRGCSLGWYGDAGAADWFVAYQKGLELRLRDALPELVSMLKGEQVNPVPIQLNELLDGFLGQLRSRILAGGQVPEEEVRALLKKLEGGGP